MILCVCHRVSDNIVRQLLDCRIQRDQIVELTKATTRCGICTADFNKYCDQHEEQKEKGP